MSRLLLLFLALFMIGAVVIKRGPHKPPLLRGGVGPPATCSVGELFLDTNEIFDAICATTADNSICVCHATNTWETSE